MPDFTNWEKERRKLKTEILKELRDQRDLKNLITVGGSFTFAPRGLAVGDSQEFGPVFFNTSFSGRPSISLTSIRHEEGKNLWCLFDISRWILEGGAVEGFYFGLYALETPPVNLFNHTISWIARGNASVYRRTTETQEAWTTHYDHTDHSYMRLT